VVGHGASTPQGVASCLRTAVQAVEEGLVPRIAASLSELHDRTRAERRSQRRRTVVA
jgi:fatty acid/phospholipid biosynthesis enzyme